MTGIGIGLALLSAIATAAAHALLKGGRDRLAVRAMIGAVGSVALAPACLFVPLPDAALLPWLLAANLLHCGYQLVLIRAYATADFSVAFPLARGIVPLATALIGMAVLGDRLAAPALGGIALVSTGLLLIAADRTIAPAALAAAAAAGLFTTAYTVVDAQAVRLAPVALTFIAWFFVLDGLIMAALFAACRRGRAIALLRAEGWKGILAGLASLVGFGAALLALRIAPVGLVAALRETSVIFAMALAGLILGERIDRRRIAGALVIAAGATLLVIATPPGGHPRSVSHAPGMR